MVLTDYEKGLLVGLLEGEGSINLQRQEKNSGNKKYLGFVPYIDFTNTDRSLALLYERLAREVLREAGLEDSVILMQSREFEKWKTYYKIRIRNNVAVIFFLAKIKDFFVSSKKEKSELLIKWCSLRNQHRRIPHTEEELKIFDELRKLNRRGKEVA
jgi:hypothetical protein